MLFHPGETPPDFVISRVNGLGFRVKLLVLDREVLVLFCIEGG